MTGIPKEFSSVEPDTFGSRFLVDEDRVYEQNAWDQVEWDPEYLKVAQETMQHHLDVVQQSNDVNERRCQFETKGANYWDDFYLLHENRFFKNRHWLSLEFPELFETLRLEKNAIIWEVGCGVGNTLFPLLHYIKYGTLTVAPRDTIDHTAEAIHDTKLEQDTSQVTLIGTDFSNAAMNVLQQHPDYDPQYMQSFVHDLVDAPPPTCKSVHVILSIFVLSAMNPTTLPGVFQRCYDALKPGGYLLFRDYGRYDLAQMRFSDKRILGNHYYARGDGTRVYFFTLQDIETLASSVGFDIIQNKEDRRLIVNRRRQVKMYRVWIQSKLRKPLLDSNA